MKTAALTYFIAIGLAISISACKEPSFNSSSPNPSRSPRKPILPDRDGAEDSNKPKPSATPYPSATPKPQWPTPTPIPTPRPSATPTPQPQSETCYKGSVFACKVEKMITDLTNEYRVQSGLSPVTHDAKISFVSRNWSISQGRVGMGHSGFPSARIADYQREFNVRISISAENVAMTGRVNTNSESDAAAIALAKEFAVMWWNSSGHRMNMLGRNHKFLGVGVANTGRSWYATQLFK